MQNRILTSTLALENSPQRSKIHREVIRDENGSFVPYLIATDGSHLENRITSDNADALDFLRQHFQKFRSANAESTALLQACAKPCLQFNILQGCK